MSENVAVIGVGQTGFRARWDSMTYVELAQQAVESAPQDGMVWRTLGAAHYRASNWKAAVDALNKSMDLRQGGDSIDWLFLAMAH